MITPSYAITATERVLPRLALDFTTGVLDPRVTVTRALNTATRVNSSGFIETVNADLPRFDYDRATLLPKGLLIEETRQNLVLQSANLANATNWTPAGVGVGLAPVVTGSAGVSPTGSNDAVRVQFDCTDASSATNRSRLTQSIAVTNGTTYSRAIWIKAYDANSVGKTIRFVTDSIGVNVVHTLTNQWTRISPASAAATATSTTFTLETRGTITTQTADVLVWNATLEAGAFLTSDIITTTTSLTRNADLVSMTGTNFSDWYNQSEGAFYNEVLLIGYSGAGRFGINVSDGTSNNRIMQYLDAVTALNGRYSTSGVNTTIGKIGISNMTVTPGKSVQAYKVNDFAFTVNGATSGTSASGAIPTVDRAYFNSIETGAATNMASGWLRKVMYWPQRLTNAEVQAFSK